MDYERRMCRGVAVRACTWNPTCPEPARHRMERRESRPLVTVVETVCDRHRENARRDGYELRGPADGDDQVTVQ
jgi:hypothetical protein